MAAPTILQTSFKGGMVRDTSRDRIPSDSSWNLLDYIPEHGAPLRKRGPWAYHGEALGGTATSISALIFAEFSAAPALVVLDEDAALYVSVLFPDRTLQEPPDTDWDDVGNWRGEWYAYWELEDPAFSLLGSTTRLG